MPIFNESVSTINQNGGSECKLGNFTDMGLSNLDGSLNRCANVVDGGYLNKMELCSNESLEGLDYPHNLYGQANREQFQFLIPSFVLVCVLLVIGVLGNTLALLVYVSKMKRNTARYFIITLAFSDLVNCLTSLPVELFLLMNFWTFDFPTLCKFSRFMTAAMNNISSFVLVMIAIERFRSICTPLKPRFTSKVSKIICVTVVCLAICSAVPMVFGYGTQTIRLPVSNGSCYIVGKTCLIDDDVLKTRYPVYLNTYLFVGHIIVFVILAVLYSCIARKLIVNKRFRESNPQRILLARKSSNFSLSSFSRSYMLKNSFAENLMVPRRDDGGSLTLQVNSNGNTTRKHGGQNIRTSRLTCMLFLMTSVFEISFIPYLIIVSLRNEAPTLYQQMTVAGKMMYQLFLRSYLINCAINPLIYCFYNKHFRHGVKQLFGCLNCDDTKGHPVAKF